MPIPPNFLITGSKHPLPRNAPLIMSLDRDDTPLEVQIGEPDNQRSNHNLHKIKQGHLIRDRFSQFILQHKFLAFPLHIGQHAGFRHIFLALTKIKHQFIGFPIVVQFYLFTSAIQGQIRPREDIHCLHRFFISHLYHRFRLHENAPVHFDKLFFLKREIAIFRLDSGDNF